MLKIISFRDRFVRTAKSDIKCFKVLERKKDDPSRDTVAYSPYQDHPFTLKQEETAFLKRKFFKGEVEHGIHAFLNLSDAKKLADDLITTQRQKETWKLLVPDHEYSDSNWNWLIEKHYAETNKAWKKVKPRNYDIFECVVPQGAKYFKGVWESKYPNKLIPNIAATRLTVLRGINDPVPFEEWVEPEQTKAEPTVEQTVEERLASIAASVAAMPDSMTTFQETMQQHVQKTIR